MFKNVLVYLFVLFLSAGNISAQTFNWGIRGGSTGQDLMRSVSTDSKGNIYALLVPDGAINIDSLGTPRVIPSYGNRDVLVVKYNCDSVFQWVIRIGGNLLDGG